MNELPIGRQRFEPLQEPAVQVDAPENIQENNALQQDEAVQVHTAPAESSPITSPVTPAADYTISVEQVREHFRQKGLAKSKDTIQRWCRNGDLDCRKQGILNRYFTTEKSLKVLEGKLLPDMIADQVGTSQTSMQPHSGAREFTHGVARLRSTADTAEHTSTQVDAAHTEAERDGMQAQKTADAVSYTRTELRAAEERPAAEVAELRAQVVGLTSQLEQSQAMNKFLQDEVVSARGQRGDVVKIAEQMLGTLESMAIGGRLEKPQKNAEHSEPVAAVRYQTSQTETDAV